jgi:hypothetical protein
MVNRRQNYRHPFAAGEGIPVKITSNDLAVDGVDKEIINLSVSGMGIRFPHPPSGLEIGGRYRARFALPSSDQPLEVDCGLVHWYADKGTAGFHFYPCGNAEADEARDRRLWLFLMQAQRSARRSQLAEIRNTKSEIRNKSE